MKRIYLSISIILLSFTSLYAQEKTVSPLTLDRIFASAEFRQDYPSPISWINQGEAYIIMEYSDVGENELMKYETLSQQKSHFLTAAMLTPEGAEEALNIEDFSLSADESKVLLFTNSKRVWRSNTKGDYWVYDLTTKKLSQLGKDFPASSLMFAKFSADNKEVAYVMDFNLYNENFASGKVTKLTTDGTKDIINGTFDWVYEEEFGCRDGFRWNPDGQRIAYWQLDASKIGTFKMINNTDSIYSQIIPVQYPKVGQDPSSAKIGIVDTKTASTSWIEVPGSSIQNYIPSIKWLDTKHLMIQQINRKQNHLKIWSYATHTKALQLIYEEKEESWVDIDYPDITGSQWGNGDIIFIEEGKAFLRMREDQWRNVYKIDTKTGKETLLSPGTYDVASLTGISDNALYYMASPNNATQRYLYSVDLKGKKKDKRITPTAFSGVNNYNISPNGKYAIHTTGSALSASKVSLVSLPDHKVIQTIVDNKKFNEALAAVALPQVSFEKVTTASGVTMDARIVKPANFDADKKYPVIFHVYGEPWGQVATDSWIGMWNIMLTELGYVVIDIDGRGTPSLKGSEWRKSIYRNIGRINIKDMGEGATEILKASYLDDSRVAVWGWSGGGSSTLNLMFQYPEVFGTGVSVAPVANQLTYDNIYQERYMGLPQENKEDFVAGSPISHVAGLKGNLLIIHGTADDNVHYQNMEMIVNELIKQNKQFQMMAYPNRSHGIYEGANTRRHLYTLITNYFLNNVPNE